MTSPFSAPIAEQIWDMKYRFKDSDGHHIDIDVVDTWERIATHLASDEKEEIRLEQSTRFYDALSDFKYLPAGRITAGAGTGRDVTLFNCFVMGTVPDSMSGIFDMLKEAALTMQQGGGIGYDFSTIRPKGALVKGVAADASGPLTFMDVWDAMCRTVMSAGSRRGAMMATMRCDHPDIMDFITAKHDPARLRMFNMSVLITDDFMDAVKNGDSWTLKHSVRPDEKAEKPDDKVEYAYDNVSARDLWDAIMQSTYDSAEPGVIFIDRINAANNLNYCETIAATNPCGEQPLPPYGACLLGSINLAKLVKDPFGEDPSLDQAELKRLVHSAVRMMDNVVDVSNFPLVQQLNEAQSKRRIGLGVTGLASMLAMCKIAYGSDRAVEVTNDVMEFIDEEAYTASIDLAREKGPFPLFDADKFLAPGTHASKLPQRLKSAIKVHGIRNALLTSIAPTGTISLYAGNVSSGIEPIFAMSYDRKVLQKDGTHITETVEDYAVARYREMYNSASLPESNGLPSRIFDTTMLPDYFVSAQHLDPMAHVRMQAAAQKHVDSSISKTINCPENISFDDFKDVYMAAWDSGCKGCTTYRPNEITGSVLSVKEEEPVEVEPNAHEWDAEASEEFYAESNPDAIKAIAAGMETVQGVPSRVPHLYPASADHLPERGDALLGATYKLKWPNSEHAMYVTINDIEVDGQRRPFEVFINSKDMVNFSWIVGLTRMISAIFRRPHDSTFVVEELKAVFDPSGGAWIDGEYVPSKLAAIGSAIETHMKSIGYIPVRGDNEIAVAPSEVQMTRAGELCPACGQPTYINQSGCKNCTSCGHSACG